MTRLLVAVLANPPLGPGTITRQRVATAGRLLGFENTVIDNIFPLASPTTNEIGPLGANPLPWQMARTSLEANLSKADGVLLGYGCKRPTGIARHHFDSQILWLYKQLAFTRAVSWMVGDRPHHPSRWQRYTARNFPEMGFAEALPLALVPFDPSDVLNGIRYP